MKKLSITLITLACFSVLTAQEPQRKDSSRIGHKPGDRGTDSVRSGNQIFHGGKGQAEERQKTTNPKKPNSSPTSTNNGNTPKYPR